MHVCVSDVVERARVARLRTSVWCAKSQVALESSGGRHPTVELGDQAVRERPLAPATPQDAAPDRDAGNVALYNREARRGPRLRAPEDCASCQAPIQHASTTRG